MKILPKGISDYKTLIERGCYYVDKTMYLSKLESVDDTIIYLRPRRFGKTLFTSMMYYYYDIGSKDLFNTLFKETYVYTNPTPNKNNYYILKLDFSGMTIESDNVTSIMDSFSQKLYFSIELFLNHYGLYCEIDRTLKPAEQLNLFLSYYNSLNLGKGLYIIIDEYDNFTNALLGKSVDTFKEVLSDDGFVKAFYAAIKASRGTIIDRVFITGVSSISLDAMTSGFNVGTNITTHEWFNSMTALTHEEVKSIINIVVEKEKMSAAYQEMVDNYDGYIFSDNMESTFNPTLAMYYLSNYQLLGKPPLNLMDPNIMSSASPIESVMKLDNNEFYISILDNLLKNNREIGRLKYKFDLKTRVTREDIISLLFYFGYLTIEDYDDGEYTYRIPNKVMRDLFVECFINVLNDENMFTDNESLREAIRPLCESGDIDPLLTEISENIKNNSNRIYLNFNEKNIQVMLFTLLYSSRKFYLFSEYETINGYIDIYLKRKERKSNFDIMIELKYIKVSDYSDKVLAEKFNEGEEQIKKYSQDKRIEKDHLKKYVIVFVGSEYYIKEVS